MGYLVTLDNIPNVLIRGRNRNQYIQLYTNCGRTFLRRGGGGKRGNGIKVERDKGKEGGK